jgi:hypothetical protein
MIARDAAPIANRNPYKRVDLARRSRPAVVTAEDVRRGATAPDPAFYDYDYYAGEWRLKS